MRLPLALQEGFELLLTVQIVGENFAPGEQVVVALRLGNKDWAELQTAAQFHVSNIMQILANQLPEELYSKVFHSQNAPSNTTRN